MLNVYPFQRIVYILKSNQSRSIISSTTYCGTVKGGGKKLNSKSRTKMQRKWQPDLSKLEMIEVGTSKKQQQQYKLLSYNILSQDLLVEHLHLYYSIDPKLLRWEKRLHLLKEEVSQLQPDIMCLQEMQYDHLKDLVHHFSGGGKRKFEYVYKKKTGTRSDGCAIIYDSNKFRLIAQQNVEYYTDGVATLNRENIAIMAKFQIFDGTANTQFVVATTHLLYNPRREDVRISQVNKLLRSIVDFCSVSSNLTVDTNDECSRRLPVILTGDFNFTPNTRAFEILTALRKFKPGTENQEEQSTKEKLFQMDPIDFGRNGASTYQDQWITVDYILASRRLTAKDETTIKVNSIYKLPSVDTCWKHGKIPSTFVGSDHFSLAIQFSVL